MHKFPVSVYILFLLIFHCIDIYSHPSIEPNLKIDNLLTPTDYDVYDYQIGCDNSGNVYYVWFEAIYANPSSHRIMFRKSTDYGQSFSVNPISIPFISASNGISFIKMVNDNSGHIYVIWVNNFNGDRQICFNRSINYGQTWQPQEIRIDNGNNKDIPISPDLNCDNSGHVYTAWQDNREGGYHIFFNFSTNYGQSWQTVDYLLDTLRNVNAGSVEICCNDNNYVYALWMDKRINKYRLFMNYSSNNGITWRPRDSRVDNDNTNSFNPFEDHKFDCDNAGNLYAAWRTYDGNKWTVNFNRSSNHGANWEGQDLRIDKSPEGIHINPISLAAGSNGFVYGIWCYGISPDNNVSKLFFNYSSNYGLTWQQVDRRLDNAPSNYHARYANLEIDNSGKVFVIWQQEPYCTPNPCFNMQDIYMNYSLNNGQSWNNTAIRIDDARDNTAQHQPIITCNNSGNAFVSWRDNRNNPVFGNPLINYYSVKLNFSLTPLSENENTIPSNYNLHQNYPNPFNPSTKIGYEIPITGFLKLVIYDALGSEVQTLISSHMKAGKHKVVWDASKYSSGVYFYKLIADGFVETKKMLLVK